jgi:hypothetical protein
MEATTETHHHHEMPTSGRALTSVAISATLHCLTGCALGEIAGMAIGTALGFSNFATIVLAIALAFVFGYSLTSLPLLRAGLALGAVIPIALASDTLSILTMEVVDNLIVVAIPGAMHAGLGDLLFWGSLSFALAVAFVFAVPVNRYLLARGKGHTAVHETGIHGGPPVKVVGTVAVLAFVFGSGVLIAEAIGGDDPSHGGGHMAMGGGAHGGEGTAAPVRGLGPTSDGLTLKLSQNTLPVRRRATLAFTVVEKDGKPLREYEVEHTKRMHLIVVRRDLTGFQHLHPRLGADGRWTTPLTIAEPGSYRVFADFKSGRKNYTLAADLEVRGNSTGRPLPPPADSARTADGYTVTRAGRAARAGRESELAFSITKAGKPVKTEPYLGAGGHLVALRRGDLAFLHVHPTEHGAGTAIRFMTKFPTPGRYRLFLQFKHRGKVHTAAFTERVVAGP